MKSKFTGKVTEMTSSREWVSIKLDMLDGGVTEGGAGPDSRHAGFDLTIRVKPLVGEGIRFGKKFKIMIETEEE